VTFVNEFTRRYRYYSIPRSSVKLSSGLGQEWQSSAITQNASRGTWNSRVRLKIMAIQIPPVAVTLLVTAFMNSRGHVSAFPYLREEGERKFPSDVPMRAASFWIRARHARIRAFSRSIFARDRIGRRRQIAFSNSNLSDRSNPFRIVILSELALFRCAMNLLHNCKRISNHCELSSRAEFKIFGSKAADGVLFFSDLEIINSS